MASNNFINECKNRAYENRLGKLSIDDIEYNQSNNLSSFEIENNIYSNGTIIGNTYSKSIKASLINVDKDTPFVGKTVSPSVGVKYSNNTTEYLDFDDYIVETINDKQTNNLTEITGYDTLDKLNTKYVFGLDENSSHTIGEYWNDLLLNLGFQTHTNTFTNSDIVIPANPFVNNETNRVVLSEIEKVSCNFAKITKENGVHYIDLVWFDEKESNEEALEIDGNATITDMARITNLELQGDTQQDGTPIPESPIPVEVVTGRQEIDISQKNLFNTVLKQGGYYFSNGNYFNSTNYVCSTDFINVVGGETYTLTFKGNSNNYNGMGFIFYNKGMYIGNSTIGENVVEIPNGVNQIKFTIYNPDGITPEDIYEIQLEKNNTSTDYEEYKGKKYEINLGKNLFDNAYGIDSNVYTIPIEASSPLGSVNCYEIQLEINTTYTLTIDMNGYEKSNSFIAGVCYSNGEVISLLQYGTMSNITTTVFTTDSTGKIYVGHRYGSADDRMPLFLSTAKIQLEKGSEATTYSPYKIPIELCKIGNYQDRIYKEDGKWYIEKQIGKLILDGSETGWVAQSTSTAGLYRYNYNFLLKSGYQNAISSHFEMSEETSFANINTVCFATHPSNHMFCFFVNNDSVDTWRAWLTNNNVTVYYVLENSTFLEITDEELLNELNSIKAFVGVNNISISSSNLGLLLNIDYYKSSIDYEFQTSDYSTLDGGLIEYGPINSVILGNKNISGENVVREDDDDIQRDGEHSIFIDAEYFLFNQSLREQAIDGIWKKLYGFRYYDLSLSTPYGKPFLEVGDKIRVNTNEGNVYDTYILSHKFTFDGTFKTELNSPAFTEQEQIVKSTESISSSIKRTEIMVDKANQEIVSVVQNSEELAGIVNSQGENIESLGTRLTQTVDSFTASISSLQEQVDDGVNYVKTTSVTIDDDGLSVSTDTSRIKTTMTNNEFKITDSGETVLAKFGYDETAQNSIAEMDNLTVKNYFVVGNHRVEKCGTNKERTGFFYIGG